MDDERGVGPKHGQGVEHTSAYQGTAEGVVHFDSTSFVGATLALGLAGGIVAAYGTILVGIANHFSLSISTAGLTLSANFAGAVAGVLLCWWALGRMRGGRALTASLLVLAAGLLCAAVAPSWPVFLAAVFIGGVGFGAVDFAVVSLIARTEPGDRAGRLSVSGAGWGFGAIAGPLLIVFLHPHRYQLFLAIAALIGLVLIAVTKRVAAPVPPRQLPLKGSTSAVSVLPVFVAALGFYVALETSVAGWLATQLHGWGYTATVGAAVTAGFWAGLAIGRLGAGRVAARWSGQRLVIVGLVVTIVLLMGASVRVLAPVMYPLVGFAIAAVFPLGLHWFTVLRPDDVNGIGWLLLVDMVGGVVGSGVANLAVALVGLRAVPFVAAGFAVLCLGAFVRAQRFPVPLASDARVP